MIGFTGAFVFPLYWMVTGALKSPDELAQIPPSFFPKHFDFGVYKDAWDQLQLGVFLKNTALYAGGAWLFTLAVDVTAAYALSKLRPVLRQADPRRDAGDPDDPADGPAAADVPAWRRTCRSSTPIC